LRPPDSGAGNIAENFYCKSADNAMLVISGGLYHRTVTVKTLTLFMKLAVI
jgi:hypothetical protein